MYKLAIDGVIDLESGVFAPQDIGNRHYQEYLAWLALGNTPEPADKPTPAQLARQAEITQAPLTARAYFAASPAAVAFVRMTPEQQAAAIDAMTTLAQVKTVVKYLAVAVSAAIKREYLNGG